MKKGIALGSFKAWRSVARRTVTVATPQLPSESSKLC
jgi:hypothetical protein